MRTILLTIAVALTAVAGLSGDLQVVSRIAVGVVVAGVAMRYRASNGQPARLLVAGLLVLVLADVGALLTPDLDLALTSLALLVIAATSVVAMRALGRRQQRASLIDAGVAAAALVAMAWSTVSGDQQAQSVVLIAAIAAMLVLWGQFLVVRRDLGTVSTLIAVSIGLQSAVGLVVAVGGEPWTGSGLVVGLLSRVMMAIAVTHPLIDRLFEVRIELERRTSGARVISTVGLVVAVGVIARTYAVTGVEPDAAASLMPLAVLAWAGVRIGELYSLAMQDNESLRLIARLDPETGVLNELGVIEEIGSRSAGSSVCVVDIAGFRPLLRRLEVSTAMELPLATADRLEEVVGEAGVVARCDTDEFVLVTDGDAEQLAAAVHDTLGSALFLPASAVSVNIAVRIGHARIEAGDANATLARARYAASTAESGRTTRFGDELVHRYRRDQLLMREFPKALREGQVVGRFQPIVETATGRIASFELLARWTHPDLGPVSPGEFVPIAESSGAIVELGELLIEQACQQLARWQHELGRTGIRVAVNVSPRQLAAGTLDGIVRRALATTGVPARSLVLELTEGIVTDLDAWGPVLRELQSIGVGVAVDDFGTGYSSMAYLEELRPDLVKVDRRFTQVLAHPTGRVARSVFHLLAELDVPVVAEGVEDIGTVTALQSAGCTYWQGFLLAPALTSQHATDLLRSETEAPVPGPAVARTSRSTLDAPAAVVHGGLIGSYTRRAVTVDDTATWRSLEQLFVEDDLLESVAVRRQTGGWSTMGAATVHRLMSGLDEHQREMRRRRSIADDLGPPVPAVPTTLTVPEAISAAMVRPVDRRYDDLLVGDADEVGFVPVATLLTELASGLTDMARRDDLTGVSNRRHLLATLGRWLSGGDPVAVLHVAVDDSEPVTGTSGRAARDRVLASVADVLRSSVSHRDTVARLGGDEFAVAMVAMDDEQVDAVSRRVLRGLDDLITVDDASPWNSVSIGRALGGFDGAEEAVAAARRSMQAAGHDRRRPLGPIVRADDVAAARPVSPG